MFLSERVTVFYGLYERPVPSMMIPRHQDKTSLQTNVLNGVEGSPLLFYIKVEAWLVKQGRR
jgi:hypothetical protein